MVQFHSQHWFEDFELICPSGTVYRFNSGERCVMTFEGLGMPDINYITQRGPFQHGETMIDFRLEKRIIQILLRQDSCSRWDYWDLRADLINKMRPNRSPYGTISPGQFVVSLPDASKRAVHVTIDGGSPRFGPRDLDQWDEWGYTETLRFIAHDPVWYDPTEVCDTLAILASDDELVFPITFKNPVTNPDGTELVFQAGVIYIVTSVAYLGTWITFPNFVIQGPLYGPTITNNSTGQKIKLNYNVLTGEEVSINLQYGQKSVVSDINGDIIGAVSDDSDLTGFHLEPDPGVVGGINEIVVSGGNAAIGTTQVDMSYFTRYIGI